MPKQTYIQIRTLVECETPFTIVTSINAEIFSREISIPYIGFIESLISRIRSSGYMTLDELYHFAKEETKYDLDWEFMALTEEMYERFINEYTLQIYNAVCQIVPYIHSDHLLVGWKRCGAKVELVFDNLASP